VLAMALVHEELSFEIRGALYDVYKALGPGFREETYKLAVVNELQMRGIPVAREVAFEIKYKDVVIDLYRADMIVDGKVILEVKAIEASTRATRPNCCHI
jgi:GxxExxY protein